MSEELNDKQIRRIDEVNNACYDFCKLLTENEDLPWNMSFIGEICDMATDIMVDHGYRVYYPSIVYETDDPDEEGHVEDYVLPVKKGTKQDEE